jgi:hypothetical protein
VDTEAIAKEIVRIKNRLLEIEDQQGDTEVEEERKGLEQGLRSLQAQLSAGTKGRSDDPDEPAGRRNIQYLPPA